MRLWRVALCEQAQTEQTRGTDDNNVMYNIKIDEENDKDNHDFWRRRRKEI